MELTDGRVKAGFSAVATSAYQPYRTGEMRASGQVPETESGHDGERRGA